MADWIPVISQIKSLVQLIGNDSKGARQTQINFSKRCPLVSQVRSAGEALVYGSEAAKKTQLEFVSNLGNAANNVPVIGHAKGAVHYICGDFQDGHDAMKAASRSIGTVIGAGIGMVAGGPPGAAVCSAAGATVADGMITGIASYYNGKLTPNGVLKGICDIVDDPKNPGLWVDTALIVVEDGFEGQEED